MSQFARRKLTPCLWRQFDRILGRHQYGQSSYVLPRHELVICCAPKVGSTAIKIAVMASLGLDGHDRSLRNSQRKATDFWVRPQRAKQYGYPTVGMIRDPVDRFISAYAFRYRGRVGWTSRLERMMHIHSLEDCLAHYRDMNWDRDVHFWPQSYFLEPVVDPWPFEQIDSWWEHVRSLSVAPLPPLDPKNQGKHPKPMPDQGLREEIQQIYLHDCYLYDAAVRHHRVRPKRGDRHKPGR